MTRQLGGLGRLRHEDPRRENYPLRAALVAPPPERRERYWYASGWKGDQQDTSMCVAYAWLHFVADGPVTHKVRPALDPAWLYTRAQEIDGITGLHDGTTTQAGAKVLQSVGLVETYRWAQTPADVIDALLATGPLVVGINWYSSLDHPDSYGYVTLDRTSPIRGGHDIEADGIDLDHEYGGVKGWIRLKQSWGTGWGRNGFCNISIDDLAYLVFSDGGEACLASELKGP